MVCPVIGLLWEMILFLRLSSLNSCILSIFSIRNILELYNIGWSEEDSWNMWKCSHVKNVKKNEHLFKIWNKIRIAPNKIYLIYRLNNAQKNGNRSRAHQNSNIIRFRTILSTIAPHNSRKLRNRSFDRSRWGSILRKSCQNKTETRSQWLWNNMLEQ